MTTIRTATVRGHGASIRETIERYLPANYHVVGADDEGVYIEGYDNAGWTMTDYVIPRLASGLYFAEETTQS